MPQLVDCIEHNMSGAGAKPLCISMVNIQKSMFPKGKQDDELEQLEQFERDLTKCRGKKNRQRKDHQPIKRGKDMPKQRKLTLKQQKFVNRYMEHGNA